MAKATLVVCVWFFPHRAPKSIVSPPLSQYNTLCSCVIANSSWLRVTTAHREKSRGPIKTRQPIGLEHHPRLQRRPPTHPPPISEPTSWQATSVTGVGVKTKKEEETAANANVQKRKTPRKRKAQKDTMEAPRGTRRLSFHPELCRRVQSY